MSGRSRRVWAWVGIVCSAIYMLNPDAGILEPIPDVLPLVGNLDEAGVTMLLLKCVRAVRAAGKPGV